MNESRNFNRGERPSWIDNVTNPVNSEWILYDSKTQKLRFAKASNQKEAIKIALERNIIPRVSEDIRPREGDSTDKIMSPEEFNSFIQQIKN